MYKTRGRPEDPWNQEAAIKEKSIAETIQIRPLHKTSINSIDNPMTYVGASRDERTRRRQHYEEFRETYQQKFQRLKEESLQKKLLMKQELDEYMESKRDINQNIFSQSRQTSTSNRLTIPDSIKTISVEAPHPRKTGAISLPPNQSSTFSKILPVNKSVSKTILMKQLAETQEQINEANDQLLQIQTILKQKQKKFDTSEETISPPNVADLYKNNPFARYTLLQSSNHRLDNKFEIGTPFPSGLYTKKPENETATKNSTSSRSKSSKESKIKQTLKDVNDMIQKMQEKYFAKNRTKYRSIDNYMKNSKAPVSVLFENEKINQCEGVNLAKTSRMTEIEDVRINNNNNTTGADIKSRTCDSLDTYSSCNESQPSIGSKMEKIFQDSSSVSMILPPKEYDCSKTTSEDTKATCCINFRTKKLIPKEDESFYDLNNKIRDSISSSEYLSREFPCDKYLKTNNESSSCSRKKSVHFSKTDTNNDDDYKFKKDAQLNAFIKSALKESFYRT